MSVSMEAWDALKEALKLEQDGSEFYLKAAERTVDERGAAMFRSLADDEMLHAQIIQRQMDSLTQDGEWAEWEPSLTAPADLATPLFPKGEAEFKKIVSTDANELEALAFALKIENDSFNLYLQQAKAATDLYARRMYEYLVSAERTHFNLLMSNYESITSMGGWVG